MPLRLNITVISGLTSWKKSRSAVTIVASIPCSAARVARVPIASSASLPSAIAQHGDLQRLQHLLDQPQLWPEVARGLGPARLVLGVLGQSHGGRARVEEHRDQVGSLLGQQLDQHAGEPVDRVRDRAAGGGERGREREERPVGQRVSVEQEESPGGVLRVCASREGSSARIVVCAHDDRRPGFRRAAPRRGLPRSALRARGGGLPHRAGRGLAMDGREPGIGLRAREAADGRRPARRRRTDAPVHRRGPRHGDQPGAPPPPRRAPADRHHRTAVAQGAPGGRTVGTRDLRRGGSPAGRDPRRPGGMSPRQPDPRFLARDRRLDPGGAQGRVAGVQRSRCAGSPRTSNWSST